MGFTEWKRNKYQTSLDESLKEHDRRYHQGEFDFSEKCKFRENMEEEAKVDEVSPEKIKFNPIEYAAKLKKMSNEQLSEECSRLDSEERGEEHKSKISVFDAEVKRRSRIWNNRNMNDLGERA